MLYNGGNGMGFCKDAWIVGWIVNVEWWFCGCRGGVFAMQKIK